MTKEDKKQVITKGKNVVVKFDTESESSEESESEENQSQSKEVPSEEHAQQGPGYNLTVCFPDSIIQKC